MLLSKLIITKMILLLNKTRKKEKKKKNQRHRRYITHNLIERQKEGNFQCQICDGKIKKSNLQDKTGCQNASKYFFLLPKFEECY